MSGVWSQFDELLAARTPGLTIDVGAYDGQDAVRFAKAGHRVLSFEPVPSKAMVIERNIRKSGFTKQISFHAVALSNFTGSASFQVNTNLKKSAEFQEGSEQDGFFVPWKGSRSVEVPVRMLDDYIAKQSVLYLKIDAQGHDVEVLAGARKALSENRIHFVNFELSPKLRPDPAAYINVLGWLSSLGYTCHDCKYFKSAGLRGQTEDLLRVEAQRFVEKLSTVTFTHRGADHGAYTEVLCAL